MNTSKANTNKPWMSDEYDMPVLENEELWSQRVIDETAAYLWLDIEREENVNKKEKDQRSN
jgi:hypothetical protein